MSISAITNSAQPLTVPIPQPPAPAPQPVEPAADTVKLSQNAQIQLLTQQGQSPAQIAGSLGISISVIDTELSIVVPTAAASTTTAVATSSSTATTAVPAVT